MEHREPAVHLGRGFWSVTFALAIVAALSIYAWVVAPIAGWLPEAANKAQQIDALFRFLAASGTALFVFVVGYLLYFAIAFRRRANDPPDALGVQIHDNNALEFWWTLIPTVFLVILVVFSIRIWAGIELGPNTGLTVEAIGHQWYFTFRYPQINGEITNAMHLPVGQPVTLRLTSADVIHSFWVPGMRMKADMVPGLINTLHFTPKRVGRYQIICAEFCGTLHGEMDKQWFVVDPPVKYAAWYDAWQKKNSTASNALPVQSNARVAFGAGDAKIGKQLFSQKCTACHALGPFSQRIVGPGLLGVLHDPAHPNLVNGDKATRENVAEILQNGYKGDMGQMPNQIANALSNTDIANLVAYLNTLK